MKPVLDLLQIALQLPGPLGLIACAAFLLLLWQVCKTAGEVVAFVCRSLKWLKGRFVRITAWRVAGLLAFAFPVFLIRGWVVDRIQYLEWVIDPVYVSSDTTGRALAVYEAQLDKVVDPYEASVIKRRTREIAAKVGCTPQAIYEVAYSECALNPFCVRADGIAAGWIQFTAAGVTGITTLQEVKTACKARDVEKMMDLTEAYLVGRSGGVPLIDATGVYVCVFAPGHVGKPDSQVLYSGFGNPAYYLNKGLDGYFTRNTADGRTQVLRDPARCDGQITIQDLRLALEAKKARLISQFQNSEQ